MCKWSVLFYSAKMGCFLEVEEGGVLLLFEQVLYCEELQ